MLSIKAYTRIVLCTLTLLPQLESHASDRKARDHSIAEEGRSFSKKDLTVIEEGFLKSTLRFDEKTNCSGSQQLSHAQFEYFVEALKEEGEDYTIIDLREENHLFRGKHTCVSVQGAAADFQQGLKAETIQRQEEEFVKRNPRYKTEVQVVGADHYLRIPVTDAKRPEDADVDRFLAHWSKRSPHSRIHFHCQAGMGCATTFMSLAAMLSPTYAGWSFEAIIAYQYHLGGENLLNVWYPSNQKQWEVFLRNFYTYANDSNGYKANKKWSEWVSKADAYAETTPLNLSCSQRFTSNAKFFLLRSSWSISYGFRQLKEKLTKYVYG